MRCFTDLFARSGFVFALSIALPILIGCTGFHFRNRSGSPFRSRARSPTTASLPPAGCIITFINSERNFPATAQIAADGTYTLLFNGKPEVPVGKYKVSVTAPVAAAAQPSADPSNPEAYKAMMMNAGMSKGSGQANVATIPKKYATPEASGVTFSVVEEPATYDLDMKD